MKIENIWNHTLALDIQTPGEEVFGHKKHTPNIPKHLVSRYLDV